MNKNNKAESAAMLYQKAEALLKMKHPTKIGFQSSEADMLKLMHEIEVYQIELEMQNEELRLAKEQADIATEKYIDLYDFAPSGYLTLTKEGQIIDLNLSGANMLAKERAGLKNRRLDLFVSDETKPIFNLFLEKVFEHKTKESCEVSLFIKNNLSMYVYLTGTISEYDGQCHVIMVDISERKKAEIDLLEAKKHAEESDRLKTAFLQNMSHEIRTPMNAIMGFSDLLTTQFCDKLKLEQFAKIIHQRSTDLLDIINDVLDIAKIESGQMQIRMEVCDLYGLFGELLTFFTEQQKHMGKQHLFFNLQAPKNLVIITDKVKLKQIFINLISNAFKYTNEGKIEGGCKFDSNHNLIFYVSDTGIGIPPDKQKLVFERFTQLSEDKKNKIGGTGLGLAIVKGLANLLGAEILLESEPGKGSTFSFIIPHKTIKTVHQESLKTEEQTKLYFSNKNILVVEDDRYNAEYLKEILSDHGLNILYAANGQEAIQKALDQPIDLVLMDVRLPDIDGYEATRQIRLHKPNLEIIAQTAFASPDEKQKALDAGCNDYISKPTAKDLLLSMISKHLEKK